MSAGYVVPDEWVTAAMDAWWRAEGGARSAFHIALAAVIPAIQNAALERAAVVAEAHQAEVQSNIDDNISEVRVVKTVPSDNWPLINARNWLKHTAAAIRALGDAT
jgi:hypothetical protein